MTRWADFDQTLPEACLGEEDSILYKWWVWAPRGQRGGAPKGKFSKFFKILLLLKELKERVHILPLAYSDEGN